MREHLATVDDSLGDLPLLTADVDDDVSLKDVANRARVVITTVGPYLRYGEPLVAACAEAGTDYVDLTGEPEFVDRTYVAHHATAQQTGARLVHACGFDSIPHDLGAYFTVQQLPDDVPITLRGVVRAGAHVLGRHLPLGDERVLARPSRPQLAYAARREIEPRPEGRRSRAVSGQAAPRHACSAAGCSRCPRSTRRSWPAAAPRSRRTDPSSATPTTPAPRPCGTPSAAPRRWPRSGWPRRCRRCGGRCSVASRRARAPTRRRRAKSWFTVDFVGEGGGQTVRTRVSGGDPGYDETAKMLAESALCLAFDDNPRTAGQVTTAQAMGDALTGRLRAAGLKFEVL